MSSQQTSLKATTSCEENQVQIQNFARKVLMQCVVPTVVWGLSDFKKLIHFFGAGFTGSVCAFCNFAKVLRLPLLLPQI